MPLPSRISIPIIHSCSLGCSLKALPGLLASRVISQDSSKGKATVGRVGHLHPSMISRTQQVLHCKSKASHEASRWRPEYEVVQRRLWKS